MTLSVWAIVATLSVAQSPTPATGVPLLAAPPLAGSGDGAQNPEASVAEPILPPTADDDQKPPAEKPGFGGTFTFDNSVPSGTFIFNNAYTFNPAVTTNLYLRPSYTFKAWAQTLRAEVWQNFYVNDILDKNTPDTRRFDWSDMRLSIYDDKVYEEPHTKIAIGAFIRGSIPISYESQYETKITSLSAGVTLKKNIYRFNIQLGLQALKNFNRFTSAQFPCSASAVSPVGLGPGGAPDISSTAVINGFQNGICRTGDPSTVVSFVNVDWALVPNGSIAYNFSDKLQLSLALYYFDEFAYPVPVDQYSTQIKDSNGNPVAAGQGRADGIWGITELSYNLDQHWGLSLGLWNAALPAGVPPKTADNKNFRFPFLDTYSLNSNDWNLFLDITASF